ncbi:hypothetical protein QBC39DRAFT_340507 [Podospora conica]|nr:hypothetical protein QBC39DRAFT_340507 [Schizothecium conicum]
MKLLGVVRVVVVVSLMCLCNSTVVTRVGNVLLAWILSWCVGKVCGWIWKYARSEWIDLEMDLEMEIWWWRWDVAVQS